MSKKLLAALGLALTLGFTNMAAANHEDTDPYEPMCQSTGMYADIKLPVKKLDANNQYRIAQLFGQCGNRPNVLIMEEAAKVQGVDDPSAINYYVTVWESQGRNEYWKQVIRRRYSVAQKGMNMKTEDLQLSEVSFIKVKPSFQPFALTVERYASAKPGSPIFPSAEGNLQFESGGGEADDFHIVEAYQLYQALPKG